MYLLTILFAHNSGLRRDADSRTPGEALSRSSNFEIYTNIIGNGFLLRFLFFSFVRRNWSNAF